MSPGQRLKRFEPEVKGSQSGCGRWKGEYGSECAGLRFGPRAVAKKKNVRRMIEPLERSEEEKKEKRFAVCLTLSQHCSVELIEVGTALKTAPSTNNNIDSTRQTDTTTDDSKINTELWSLFSPCR